MNDLISRQEAVDLIKGMAADALSHGITPRLDPDYVIEGIINGIPAAEEISREKYEILELERDEMIEQLRGIGIVIGQRPDDGIMKIVGEPAVLEQLAEECAECGQAALKLSRILRGENPTPMKEDTARAWLVEEMEDVTNCLYLLGGLKNNIKKMKRWRRRLDDAGKC